MIRIVLLIIVFGLASCKGIQDGTVIEKWYEKERRYVTYIYVNKIMIPQWHTDDEDFMITIKKDKKTNDINLTKDEWLKIEPGEYVSFIKNSNK